METKPSPRSRNVKHFDSNLDEYGNKVKELDLSPIIGKECKEELNSKVRRSHPKRKNHTQDSPFDRSYPSTFHKNENNSISNTTAMEIKDQDLV